MISNGYDNISYALTYKNWFPENILTKILKHHYEDALHFCISNVVPDHEKNSTSRTLFTTSELVDIFFKYNQKYDTCIFIEIGHYECFLSAIKYLFENYSGKRNWCFKSKLYGEIYLLSNNDTFNYVARAISKFKCIDLISTEYICEIFKNAMVSVKMENLEYMEMITDECSEEWLDWMSTGFPNLKYLVLHTRLESSVHNKTLEIIYTIKSRRMEYIDWLFYNKYPFEFLLDTIAYILKEASTYLKRLRIILRCTNIDYATRLNEYMYISVTPVVKDFCKDIMSITHEDNCCIFILYRDGEEYEEVIKAADHLST